MRKTLPRVPQPALPIPSGLLAPRSLLGVFIGFTVTLILLLFHPLLLYVEHPTASAGRTANLHRYYGRWNIRRSI